MSKILECVICDGETKKELVSKTFHRFGQDFTYHNIKAEVCQKCGERFLDGVTITNIEKEIREKAKTKTNEN